MIQIKKLLASSLAGSLLLFNTFGNSYAMFNIDEYINEMMNKKMEKIKSIGEVESETDEIESKIEEVISKIKSGEISLEDKKINTFIKQFKFEEWNNHLSISLIALYQIAAKIAEQNGITKEHIEECFKNVKEAHCQLIDNDPNFSSEFKKEIKEKIMALKLFIPGITCSMSELDYLELDTLLLKDGTFSNLNKWEKTIDNNISTATHIHNWIYGSYRSKLLTFIFHKYPKLITRDTIAPGLTVIKDVDLENPENSGNPEELQKAINEFDNLKKDELKKILIPSNNLSNNDAILLSEFFWKFFPHHAYYCNYATMHSIINTVSFNPFGLLTEYNSNKDQLTSDLLSTFGHEITHFILDHFEEHQKSIIYGNDDKIIYGNKKAYEKYCKKYDIEYKEDDELNFEKLSLLRDKVLQNTIDNKKETFKELIDLPNEKDKEYITKIFDYSSKYIDKIKTGLYYNNDNNDVLDELIGLPIVLEGKRYFAENMADVIGSKAAILAAKKININEDDIYKISFNSFFKPQKKSDFYSDSHLPFPFRQKVMYNLSKIDPDIFGFKDFPIDLDNTTSIETVSNNN